MFSFLYPIKHKLKIENLYYFPGYKSSDTATFCIRSSDNIRFYLSPYILAKHSPIFAKLLQDPRNVIRGKYLNVESRYINTWLKTFYDHEGARTTLFFNSTHYDKIALLCKLFEMYDLLHEINKLRVDIPNKISVPDVEKNIEDSE